MSRWAQAIIVLVVVLALALALGYLGRHAGSQHGHSHPGGSFTPYR